MTTSPENRSATAAPAFPAPVTVPRSPVPVGPDTPANGNVTGHGAVVPGNVPVPGNGSRGRFPSFARFKIGGNDHGNGLGNGSGERSPVPVPEVPATAEPTDAEAVTEASDKADEAPKRTTDWVTLAMWLVIIVLNALALMLASSGQIEGTWKWAGLDGDDPRKWLLPAITEVGYLGFLLLGADALRRKQSPFSWWALAGAVAGAAIFMNSVHGEEGHKFQQGLIFGVASGVSLALTFAKFLIDYRSWRQKEGHTSGLRPRALTLSAFFFLPVAFRAHLIIARCERVKTKERAYELAEMWRWIYQDTRSSKDAVGDRESRRTARRTAWITVYEELGQKVPELNNITVKKVTFRQPPPPPPPPPPAPDRQAPKQRATDEKAPGDGEPPKPKTPDRKPPEDGPKISPSKPVPDHYWTDHAEHIKKVQDAIADWATRAKAPTVNEVQEIIPNRNNAANTAACIRVLRDRAASPS